MSAGKIEELSKVRRHCSTALSNTLAWHAQRTSRPNIANTALHPLSKPDVPFADVDPTTIKWIMIGVPDDRGVINNYGRAGANDGPESFRKKFYSHSMAAQAPAPASILDLGDLKLKADLGETLDNLAAVMRVLPYIFPGAKILVVGGGHDIAYGEIKGLLEYASATGESDPHHIINIDAHVDTRPLERGNEITSGTPFYRLLELGGPLLLGANYHPFGLQMTANAPALVEYIRKKGIDAAWLEDMATLERQILTFTLLLKRMETHPWHLNIDLDGFGADAAPGVSAPQPFGLQPNMFMAAITSGRAALATLRSLGIYELNPKYDEGEKTARLAAKLAYLTMSLS